MCCPLLLLQLNKHVGMKLRKFSVKADDLGEGLDPVKLRRV